jgi:hypothetical protein
MSYKIIVARYNENIEWLNSEMSNCIIYNKGNKLNIYNEILLENLGRESETYLHYIITNYYNLPDVVVFTQARIRKDGYYLKDNYKNNNPITFLEWFKNNININYPNPMCIYCNAIFAVKKENIINKPLEYYKKLILEVNHHINSTEGHFFERSWYYIFS